MIYRRGCTKSRGMSSRTYYLVLFDEARAKGCANALPSVLDEEAANVLLQDARPTVTRKDGSKYLVTQKRMFEYRNLDGSKTLFIIADCIKLKP